MNLLKPLSQYLLLLTLLIGSFSANASHIAGGEMHYTYLGSNNYQFTLTLYEDCKNGQPQAIQQDTPAFLCVYDGAGYLVGQDLTVECTSSINLPVETMLPCGLRTDASVCLLKKTFVKIFTLPPNVTGYNVVYQRCCRSAQVVNVADPGSGGNTFTCHIPASSIAVNNNSAVFKDLPSFVACIDYPLNIDFSATDADGDSLSYEFCAPLLGASPDSVKPVPFPPDFSSLPYYDTVQYVSPLFSAANPLGLSAGLIVNPVTGLITGRPDRIGVFVVCVRCNEWRGGIKINSVQMEYQLVVNTCSAGMYQIKATANGDTIIAVNNYIDFHPITNFVANSYLWEPATFLSDPHIIDPIGTFPQAGSFLYTLHAYGDSCDYISTVKVTVVDTSLVFMPTAFSPNNDGKNDVFSPVFLISKGVIKDFRVFDRKGIAVYTGTTGWDGRYKGITQDIGVYYWELVYEDGDGKTSRLKGSVTLVR